MGAGAARRAVAPPRQKGGLMVLERGDEGFEAARRSLVWNGRRPARVPDAIARAASAEDAVAAVRLARERGLKLSVRSGGHNFVGNSVRDGGLVLDVSALDGVRVDAAARRAVVGPGCKGEPLL